MNIKKVHAGDSFTLTFKPQNYDSERYYELTLSSYNVSLTLSRQDIAADGTHTFAMSASSSAQLAPGTYQWSVISLSAEADDRRTEIAAQPLEVLPDPTLQLGESYARRMLNALQGLLEGRITASDAQYVQMTYEGRSITKLSPGELMRAIALFRAQVAEEELNANNKKGGQARIVYARFK